MTITALRPAPAGPPNAETDLDTGSRWYIHPRTGERFISVTTVLSHIAKFGLPDWSARLAASAAAERLPWLVRCSRNTPCNASRTDNACGQCLDCAVYWLSNRHNQLRVDAGDRGRRIHEAAEQFELFGEGFHIDEDIAPYVDQYMRWRRKYRPRFEASEMTVISRKWGYAGTLDGILRFPEDSPLPPKLRHLVSLPTVVDIKSGKHIGIPEGWQVVAYAKADAVLMPDGTELPMPEVQAGMILHLRLVEDPKQPGRMVPRTQMREVHLTDANHQRFIHMLRVVEGLAEPLGTVLSRPVTMPED